MENAEFGYEHLMVASDWWRIGTWSSSEGQGKKKGIVVFGAAALNDSCMVGMEEVVWANHGSSGSLFGG